MRRKKRREGLRFTVSPLLVLMLIPLAIYGYFIEIISYAAAIIMHEMAHAETAQRLGYALNEFKLMPYGASLTGAFEGASARDEFLIAIAGPLSNVVFAVIFIALWWLVPSMFVYTEVYVTANVFTAVINLLPVFPLDGGRAALALASKKMPRQKAYKILRTVGFVLCSALALVAIVFFEKMNFSFFNFFIFILVSTVFPDKNSKYQRLYSMSYRMEKIKNGLALKEIIIHKDTPLTKCLRLLSGNHYTMFSVVDDSMRQLGKISETELENAAVAKGIQKTIHEVMNLK